MNNMIDLMPAKHCTIDQVSFSPVDPSVVVVTGDDFYRFYRIEGPSIKMIHNSINRRDNESHYSTNYTCHAWLD